MLNPEHNGARKRKLLRRVRRQRLKYITILPSLITLLNGVFGFAAISFASKGFERFYFHKLELSGFAVAGYLLFIAMIADMLDGRLARMSQTTSSFGGQLDSLCDMISFGVAPAFIMLRFLEHKLTEFVGLEVMVSGLMYRFIWLAAAVYMACTAIRLARFNVENEEDETAHMSFIGLPAPASAGVLASLIVFHQFIRRTLGQTPGIFGIVENIIIYALPFIAIGVAILMISRIRYPHIVNQYLKGKKPLAHLLWFLGLFGLVFLLGLQSALLIASCGFALSGFVRWFYFKIIFSGTPDQNIPEPPVLTVTNATDSRGD